MKYRCHGSCHYYTEYPIYVLYKTVYNDTFKHTAECDGQTITNTVDIRDIKKELTTSALIQCFNTFTGKLIVSFIWENMF